jgi:hypothetical protein
LTFQPPKCKSYLPDIQLVRNQADYTTKQISRKVAQLWLSKAEEMFGLIGKEIGS